MAGVFARPVNSNRCQTPKAQKTIKFLDKTKYKIFIFLYPIIATNTQAWYNLTPGLLSKQEQRNGISQKEMPRFTCRENVFVTKIDCGLKTQYYSQ